LKSLLVVGVHEDKVLEELSEVYNLSDPNDLMFIARTAKDTGAIEFSRYLMEMIKSYLVRGSNE